MIAREEARLRAMFARLALLPLTSIAPGLIAGCSTTDSSTAQDASLPTSDTGTIAPHDGGSTPLPDGAVPTPDSSGGGEDAACAPVDIDGGVDGGFVVADGAAPSDGGSCAYYKGLPCGVPPGVATAGCNFFLGKCTDLCGQVVTSCDVLECGDAGIIPTGPVTVVCATCLGIGRRPEGLAPARRPRAPDALGAWLAEAAHLEAASVHAFRRLGAELTAMKAPRALVRAAERSARDEVRHARVTTRLARRRGAVPARVVVKQGTHERSLAAFALENAIEGCVRETFGALVASRQSTHAEDAELASSMTRIAEDETRHAALAWSIARWLEPRLDEATRAQVRQAMTDAIEALRSEVSSTPGDLARQAGLPSGAEGAALVDAFASALLA